MIHKPVSVVNTQVVEKNNNLLLFIVWEMSLRIPCLALINTIHLGYEITNYSF